MEPLVTPTNEFDTLFDNASLYYMVCASTNDLLRNYVAMHGVSEGTLLLAEYQYRGRGQLNNRWESRLAHNLTFSLALYPTFLRTLHTFYLTIMTSLAVYDTVASLLGKGTSIKWPNDIYYNNQKLSGILIETTSNGLAIDSAIIGIGLNVNQLNFEHSHITSLAALIGKTLNRPLLLKSIVRRLETYYTQLQNGLTEKLLKRYTDNLYRKNGLYPFKTTTGYIEGRIVTVLPSGQLIVEESNGKSRAYGIKEIIFV